MRKFLVLALSCILVTTAVAVETPARPSLNASTIFLPVGKGGKMISLMDLSTIKIRELEILTGKNMNLFDRVGFKIAQRRLRNNINHDGTFSSRKIEKWVKKQAKGEGGGFQAGGFFLGLLLGPIGVLIAYLIKDDNKKNRVKWAWIGFGSWILIILILAASGFA